MRFAAFRRNPLPRHRRTSHRGGPPSSRGEQGLAPRDAIDPSKSSPRPQPYRVTTADPSVPLEHPRVVALPASRCRSAEVVRSERAPRLRGVALRTGPLRSTPFRASSRSFLPWASTLFVVRLPPQPPWTFQGRPETPEGEPSGRPSSGGDTPGWSRGHPSQAVGRSRRGSLSGGVVRTGPRANADHHEVLDVERALRGAFPRSTSGLVQIGRAHV